MTSERININMNAMDAAPEIESQKIVFAHPGFKVESNFKGGKDVVIEDPFETVVYLAKNNGEPDKVIFTNAKDLRENPYLAAQHIEITNEDFIGNQNPEAQAALFVAKCEAARKALDLSAKEDEHYKGVVANGVGALAFATAAASRIKNPELRRKTMSLTLSLMMAAETYGCAPINTNASTEIYTPPAGETETVDVPGFIPSTETSAPASTETAVQSTETSVPEDVAGNPYPESSVNFDDQNILRGAEAEARLLEIGKDFGVDQDILTMKNWYKANGVSEANMEVQLYEGPQGTHWDLAIKDANGRYQMITLTSGNEKGQLVRAFGMVAYINSQPGFKVSPLENPSDLSTATQKMIWDESGWSVIGAYDGSKLVYWYDADSPNGGEWMKVVEAPVSTEWQLSPDGHVYYNESELYGGLFTINTEHPENVEKYWEDTIRGLWNLNSVSENEKFLAQFPTDDSLIEYLQNGGGPVENLWIPVIYPNEARQYWNQATMVSTNEAVDLSHIAISIYEPSKDEIYSHSPSYATGTEYVWFAGANGINFKEILLDGHNVLTITLCSNMLVDAEALGYKYLALSSEKNSEENFLAANQLLNLWTFETGMPENLTGGSVAWNTTNTPPSLNTGTYLPTPAQLTNITNTNSSPISIR